MNMSWGHEAKKLTQREKAEIILEALSYYVEIDWNFREFYLKGIERGLKKLEEVK